MKRFLPLLLAILFISFLKASAQDTLFIYTKPLCSVCIQTKQVLKSRGISYIEKDVTLSENATEMLSNLSKSGYKGAIYMPVIYVGRSIMHPMYYDGNKLITVEINAVIDSLGSKNKRGEISTVTMTNETNNGNTLQFNENTSCEHVITEVYLVVANYASEKEALISKQKLIMNGYPNAGFILDRTIFRVYLQVFPDLQTANKQLVKEQFKFTDAYLFQPQ